jgi:protease YdgD
MAQDAGLDGHHAVVDADTYPWSAVGKLFNSVGGACTAAVIAPDKVLTAAHCLYAFRTHRFLEAAAIHFLLGYARGDYRIHARVAAYSIGPGYDPANETGTAGSDWAVLNLAVPLPVAVRPIAVAQSVPPAGAAIEIGGFAQDRAYLMTADTQCRLTGPIVGGSLLSHDCVIQHGDSGAPLLIAALNGAVQAVGVTVGFWNSEGRQVRIAAPITVAILPTAQARP